jgi:hypothetical protein
MKHVTLERTHLEDALKMGTRAFHSCLTNMEI